MAHNTRLGRNVALKFLPEAFTSDRTAFGWTVDHYLFYAPTLAPLRWSPPQSGGRATSATR
ncbi:MAG: hypothetical protein IH939_05195 [Acidobacteria bacterium]|nr:hypothetical protein [Acidobacteriota bacterium]